MNQWTASSLAERLNTKEQFSAEAINENAIIVTMNDAGGTKISVAISGDFMSFESLVVPEHEVKNTDDFNKAALMSVKELPLSTIALQEINGVNWYVLSGSASASSTFENVELELSTTTSNLFVVAEAITAHNEK